MVSTKVRLLRFMKRIWILDTVFNLIYTSTEHIDRIFLKIDENEMVHKYSVFDKESKC